MNEPVTKKRDPSTALVALALMVMFIWGMVAMFQARYANGDLYPPLSSMRADPQGLRVLYESCRNLDGMETRRNLRPLDLWKPEPPSTLVLAGFDSWSLKFILEEKRKRFEEMAEEGNRLVLGIKPYKWLGASAVDALWPSNTVNQAISTIGLWDWEIQLDKVDFADEEEFGEAHFTSNFFPDAEDRTINMISEAVFAVTNNAWEVLIERDGHPVMIERQFGEGSIVLFTDAYFVCNQGLFEERNAEVLHYLLQQNPTLHFDETHLGTTSSPGIAGLMRRYNLEWFVLALVTLALLYIWQNGRPLAPIPVPELEEDELTGRDHLSGVVNLLSRSMSPVEVLQEAGRRWQESLKYKKIHDAQRVEDVTRELENIPAYIAAKETPVKIYHKIQSLTTKRNG